MGKANFIFLKIILAFVLRRYYHGQSLQAAYSSLTANSKKDPMKTEAQLQQQINEARAKLDKINSSKRRKENRKYVGKCYKFKNSYDSGKWWWLHLRVVSGGECLMGHQFQHICDGRFEARHDWVVTIPGEWIEITRNEFDEAWAAFLAGQSALNDL